MLALSSPSGAGKSTLARLLLEADAALSLSVSATTRPRRPGEEDGVHYHFIDRADFAARRDAGAFLEWAEVFGNLYGTPRAPVEQALNAGRDVLFDIDWQGARQLQAAAPDDLVSVFILPPSRPELEARLRGRGADDPASLALRMAAAADEMSHWNEYDYVLVNDDLAACASSLRAILAAERVRRRRQRWLDAFAASLCSHDYKGDPDGGGQ
ncbi:MAG: guanylate kinase [Hyphomicrobiales bacterium]|nr:guanylate kinase [Hyphomicrobiales bacterium]